MADQTAERAALTSVLNLQREALIYKVSGVPETDAQSVPTASSLTLLSLVKHSAIWGKRWFQVLLAGRSFQGEWPATPDGHADATFGPGCLLRRLDGREHDGARRDSEETARHAGHADIIRETIDGSRGRWPKELDGK